MANIVGSKKHRLRYLIAAFVFATSSLLSIIPVSKAQAYTYTNSSITSGADCTAVGGTYKSLGQDSTGNYNFACVMSSTPADESKMLLSAGWIAECIYSAYNTSSGGTMQTYNISISDIQKYQLSGDHTIAGHILSQKDGRLDCGNTSNVQTQIAGINSGASNAGYQDLLGVITAAGCKQATGDASKYVCLDSNGHPLLETTMFKNIVTKLYGPGSDGLTSANKYYIALNTFIIGCQATLISNPTPADTAAASAQNSTVYNVTVVDQKGTSTQKLYNAKLGKGSNISTINPSAGGGWTNDGSFTCQSLAGMTNEYAAAYATWANRNPLLSVVPANNAGTADTSGTSTCAVDGIGWIVCPVMTFLGTINDKAYDFIAGSFLKIDVKLLSPTLPDKSVNPTYSTWGTFRNIANVLFVIVFLIIVFSQMTSAGISSYGVKKMLPRLVIAAILVNISYFVVQIAVDVSNILGYSLKSLFDTLPVYTNSSSGGVLNTIGQGLTWGVIIAGVLAAGVGIALAVSAPVLLAALLSILLTVLLLIARQAIIIILIIISPIAFVAWLLPNTEQWFKKWWKMFFSLLMVFPVIGVLFGASKMAATVMQNVGSGSSDILMQVIAMGIASIPLIMTPSLLKGSLSATGALGSKLSGLSSKANSKLGSKVKNESRFGEAMKNRQLTNMRGRAERRARPGGLQSTIDNSRIGRKLGFNAGAARAAQITDAADQEEMKNASSMLSNIRIPSATGPRALRNDEKIKLALGNDVLDEKGKVIVSAKDNHMRRAAIEQAGLVASVSEASSLVDASGLMDATMRKTLSSTLAQSSAVKKAPWLGGRTLGEVENGTANSTESLKRSIASGGITSDTLLGADLDAISKLTSYAKTGYATDQEKSILSSAEADLRNNPNYQGRVATGSDIDNELQKLRQSGPTTSGETFVDLRPGARPTQADFERAESEELERRKNNPPS